MTTLNDVAESQVVENPFTLVGVSWDGTPPESIAVRIRTGNAWSEWRTLESDDPDGPDIGTDEYQNQRHATQPVWAGESDAVQFRFVGGSPGNAEVHLVDTTNRSKPFLRRVADSFTPPQADAAVPQPGIHSRSEWDPTNTCAPREPASYVQVSAAFIHHTAGWNTYTQAEVPGYILGICLYHRNTKEWNDIAYNFLIDRFGGVWEGRAGGIDKGVQGAHSQGFNSYSTGIALLGSFHNTGVSPSASMLNGLVNLLAWKLSIHNVDPLATVSVVSKGSYKYPQGTRVTINTILGHRDTQATACPGDQAYADIPSVRTRVAARWRALPLNTYVSPLVGDFTGDGAEDGSVFRPSDGTMWVTNGSTGGTKSWGSLSPTTGWDTHLVGDFNGDGKDDLASFRSGTWTVSLSNGNRFTSTTWGSLSPTTGWDTHLVGDFNGDGKDDLASFRSGTWTVSLSNGNRFTSTTWGSLSPTTGWDTHLVGDFNGDGKDDLASFRSGTGTWQTLLSTGSHGSTGPSTTVQSYDHFSLALSFDANDDGADDIIQLDAYDGTWHAGIIENGRLDFLTLEDSPYRTTMSREPHSSKASGRFLTYFGQEFRWVSTKTGYGLGSTTSADRIWGADRYETAAAVSAKAFPGGSSIAYVATGENYPDSLAAVPAAAREGAPILLTRTASLPASTRAELLRLAPQRIVVLGGYGAVSDAVLRELDGLAPGGASRRAGPTRYETAVEASRAVFSPGVPAVYITSGTTWPEAVAAGPAAGMSSGPLLLVLPYGIPGAVRNELNRLSPGKIVIVGSTASVSASVAQQLASIAPVARISGSDRYATTAAVSASVFTRSSGPAYVATGLLYPDGLTGGVLATMHSAPLLLTDPLNLSTPTANELNRLRPTSVTVLGGEGAVSAGVASQLGSYQALGALTFDVGALPRP